MLAYNILRKCLDKNSKISVHYNRDETHDSVIVNSYGS